jgi:hypothetical protein
MSDDMREEVELPDFDWPKMAEVAADELCTPEEHPDHEACMACLAIKGTRWALEMRKQLGEKDAEIARLKGRIDFTRFDNTHPATHCLRLLADFNISVGKACEFLSKYFLTGNLDPIADELLAYDPILDEIPASDIAKRMRVAEAELASLRASVGEKPEDAYMRGFKEGVLRSAESIEPEAAPDLREVAEAIYDAILDLKPLPYVAPPSTDKES